MKESDYKKGWRSGLPETPCGAGSKLSETKVQRKWIPAMVAKYNITDIADLGAGDLNWAARTEFGCPYAAYDLVPRAQGVKKLDLLCDRLPDSDCFMLLWVLNHMTAEQERIVSDKIMNSKSRYLFVTHRDRFRSFLGGTVLESTGISNNAEIRLLRL